MHAPHGATKLLAGAHAGEGLPIGIELGIWRQNGPWARGFFESHVVEGAESQMSLLELFGRLNGQIIEDSGEPVVSEPGCQEGVCEACGFLVSGAPYRPLGTAPVCRQHLRAFPGVTRFRLEPWRSATSPIIRGLVVDRTALDELIWAGGAVDMAAGTVPNADDVAQGHLQAERVLDFAACIGCGACVAACPNGAAALFAGVKLVHLSLMPQRRIERGHRARAMTREFDMLFGPCSGFGECLPTCPAGIPTEAIMLLNREVLRIDPRRAAHGGQGPSHKQGHTRGFVPQIARSYP